MADIQISKNGSRGRTVRQSQERESTTLSRPTRTRGKPYYTMTDGAYHNKPLRMQHCTKGAENRSNMQTVLTELKAMLPAFWPPISFFLALSIALKLFTWFINVMMRHEQKKADREYAIWLASKPEPQATPRAMMMPFRHTPLVCPQCGGTIQFGGDDWWHCSYCKGEGLN
jgi:hypothetical protein